MKDSDASNASAKKAVLTFVEAAFGPRRSRLCNEAMLASIPMLVDHARTKPVREGRYGKAGNAFDWVAPSIWHAAAAILARWLRTRLIEHSFESTEAAAGFGEHWVYRGQARPWPIQPSRWRSGGIGSLGDEPIAAFREYLAKHLPTEPVIALDSYAPLSREDVVTGVAQHYGFPTHLVDFTFHPLVALYFANQASSGTELRGHPLSEHGVIYQTTFNRLEPHARKPKAKVHLNLPPPQVMKRWYQQYGFHVSCGDSPDVSDPRPTSDEYSWADLEEQCFAVYFPRTYPEATEAQDFFASEKFMRYLSSGLDPFYGMPTVEYHRLWYAPEPFFQEALTELRAYCDRCGSRFDRMEAVAFMEKARQAQAPWPNSDFGMSPAVHGVFTADPMRIVGDYLFEAASMFTSRSAHLDPMVLVAFGKENKAFFDNFCEVAKRIDLYGLPELSNKISESVSRWNELIAQAQS